MTRPLTDEEVEAIRKVLEQEARRAWLASSIRASASWIVITLGAIAIGYDAIAKTLKSIVGIE